MSDSSGGNLTDNTSKFTGKAEVYSRARPGYPAQFVDYLYTELGMNAESVIADIGSGTGILSKALLERGSVVYGVEPNADMRGNAEKELGQYSRFHSITAPAENTTLPDGSVDFVTAAQAFHWFDPARFKDECARILKPGGKVILVWNLRDENCGFVRGYAEICRRFCPIFNGFGGGLENRIEDIRFFFSGAFQMKSFPNDQILSKKKFIEGSLSASYAPREEDAVYKDFISALTSLFDAYAADGVAIMKNNTVAYIG